jgi:hypothetical protein
MFVTLNVKTEFRGQNARAARRQLSKAISAGCFYGIAVPLKQTNNDLHPVGA